MKIQEAINQSMVDHLIELCKHELEIEDLPEIKLIDVPFLNGGGKKSFGMFDGNIIMVATRDRHPMDIMRTLSHELVHWKQTVEGFHMDGSDGSESENQANAVAGIIMRRFGEKYPTYFINSLPF